MCLIIKWSESIKVTKIAKYSENNFHLLISHNSSSSFIFFIGAGQLQARDHYLKSNIKIIQVDSIIGDAFGGKIDD